MWLAPRAVPVALLLSSPLLAAQAATRAPTQPSAWALAAPSAAIGVHTATPSGAGGAGVRAAGIGQDSAAQRAGAPAIITGTVVGSDGRPMAMAHVQLRHSRGLTPDGAPEIALVQADADGRFAIASSASGGAMLTLSGAQHQPRQIHVSLRPGYRLALEARLARVRYRPSFDSVAAIGEFNGFRADTSARKMVRQRDGTWTADVPANGDAVAFTLLRVAPRGSIAAPGVTRLSRAADGTYRSVSAVRGGMAHLVFDPGQIVQDTAPDMVRYFGGAEARAARTTDSIFAQNFWAARAEQTGTPITRAQFDAVVQRVTRELDAERAAVAREALLFRLLALSTLGAEVPPRIGRAALRELPPDSPAWFASPSLAFGLPFVAFRVADSVSHLLRGRSGTIAVSPADSQRIRRSVTRYAARVDSMALAAPYDEMVAQTLAFGVAVTNGWLPERAGAFLARLQAEYPEASSTTAALRQWGNLRLLRAGVPMPAFRFTALDDTARVFTNAAFAGKTVLVDVWGTWCLPCVREMPAMHQAYEAYKASGLEILSVSVDETVATVDRFRRARWPMPWQHARVDDWMSSPALAALQIHAVPRIVLVGPDGTILAADEELRGASLRATLERVLK